MKSLIALLLIVSHCHADTNGLVHNETTMPDTEFNPDLIIAPPMPLSLDLPITMSTANRRAFVTNTRIAEEEAARNINTLHNKTIPWQIFPAFVTLLILIMIIKFPISPSKEKAKVDLSPLDIRHLALKRLDDLTAKHQQNDRGKTFFFDLDQIVRSFIEEAYHIQAPTLTTPEFLKKAATATSLDANARSQITAFLEQTDRIKFADSHPTNEEYKILVAAATQVISNK